MRFKWRLCCLGSLLTRLATPTYLNRHVWLSKHFFFWRHADSLTGDSQSDIKAKGPSWDADEQIYRQEYHLSDLRHRRQLRSESARLCLFKNHRLSQPYWLFSSLSLPQLPKSQTLPLAFRLHPPITTTHHYYNHLPTQAPVGSAWGADFYIFMLKCGLQVKLLIIGLEMRCKLQ